MSIDDINSKMIIRKRGEPVDPLPILPNRTEEEIVAHALTDPDNPPLTDDDFSRMKLVPRVKTMRRALDLTQEEFAERYQIPLGTLRDWEQGRRQPEQAARVLLMVIAHDPDTVDRAIAAVDAHDTTHAPTTTTTTTTTTTEAA